MAKDTDPNQTLHATSFLQGHNQAYVEQLYAIWAANPGAVDPSWSEYFESLRDEPLAVREEAAGAPWQRRDWPPTANGELVAALDGQWDSVPGAKEIAKKVAAKADKEGKTLDKEALRHAVLDSIRAIMYIRSFRSRGHLGADLDPLGIVGRKNHPEFDPAFFGFDDKDIDRPIFIDNVLGLEYGTMREISALLKRTYQGTFALQFMHLQDPEPKAWLQQRIEGFGKEIAFTKQGRKAILKKLVEAEGFEKFLHVKYQGTKRFGLDGGEALVPAMEQIIKRGGALGAKEIVVGMPHRGRLNVLANVMAKPFRAIFHEFQGGSYKPEEVEGSGDVKYHLGASSDREFDGNSVHLSLTANPSHLEAVNPVVIGK
ncbi:MAG: 2-oxoglutarate dehydrogenase E1 component, partial [Pseudomonadota bacterium]